MAKLNPRPGSIAFQILALFAVASTELFASDIKARLHTSSEASVTEQLKKLTDAGNLTRTQKANPRKGRSEYSYKLATENAQADTQQPQAEEPVMATGINYAVTGNAGPVNVAFSPGRPAENLQENRQERPSPPHRNPQTQPEAQREYNPDNEREYIFARHLEPGERDSEAMMRIASRFGRRSMMRMQGFFLSTFKTDDPETIKRACEEAGLRVSVFYINEQGIPVTV